MSAFHFHLRYNPEADKAREFFAGCKEYPLCDTFGPSAKSAIKMLVADINCCERLKALSEGATVCWEMDESIVRQSLGVV